MKLMKLMKLIPTQHGARQSLRGVWGYMETSFISFISFIGRPVPVVDPTP
jgi:hypothetical protein